MAKTVRRLLITSASLLTIGIICCVISVLAGVDFREAVFYRGAKNMKLVQVDETLSGAVSKLKIDIRSGKFEIKEGDNFRVVGEDVEDQTFTYGIKNGTLEINDTSKGVSGISFDWFGIDWISGSHKKKITLYIPANSTFDEVEFMMSAGKSDLGAFTTKKADITMNAGSLKGKQIDIKEKADITMNAGNMELDHMNIKNGDIDVNAGKCTIDGSFLGSTAASISAGKMELTTDLKESEYDFRTNVSAGNVEINGKRYHKDKRIDNNAANSFDVDCSAGSIEIQTK